MNNLKKGAVTLKILNTPIFMTNKEINNSYEGKWVLVKTENKNDGIFCGGQVYAIAEDTEKNEEQLWVILEEQLGGVGYLHYAYVDKGDDLNVVFGEIR